MHHLYVQCCKGEISMGGIFRWIGNTVKGVFVYFKSPGKSNADSSNYTSVDIDSEPQQHEELQQAPHNDDSLSAWQVTQHLSALILSSENLPRVAAGAVLTTASIALNFLSPYLLGETTRLLSSDDEETTTIAGYQLSRQALISLLVTTYALSQIIPNLRDQIMGPVSARNTKNILQRSTQHLLERSLNYQVNTPFSDQIYLIQKGFAVTSVGTPLLTQVGPTLFEIGLACTVLSNRYGTEMGGGLLALITLFTVYSAVTTQPIIQSRNVMLKKGNEAWEQFSGAIARYKTIRDFGKFEKTMKEVEAVLDEMMKAEIKATNLPLQINLGHVGIARIGMLIASLYIGLGVQAKRFSVQDFIMVVGYLNQLSGSLPAFGQSINQLFSAFPDMQFVFSALAKPAEVIDLHPNVPLIISAETAPSIRFDNVAFSYPEKVGKEAPLFENITFEAKPGQMVALVSESGAGKTTLFNLLYGYYSPNRGSIRINGQDISKLSLLALQKSITLIGQNPNLFKGSIRENICYGAENPDVITDEMIWALAKETHLFEFLDSLPKKLDTDVGENGKALSGGQQQKVAILRGLFKKGSIRLLDEITAPFDSRSATEVLKSIKASSKDITTLMITHKLTEAQHADQIVVIAEGQVVAQGTHNELLRSCPLYQKLWKAYQNTEHLDHASEIASDNTSVSSTGKIINVLGKKSTQTNLEEAPKVDRHYPRIFADDNPVDLSRDKIPVEIDPEADDVSNGYH